MDVFEAIHGRRSIRKYTDKPVSDADVKKILQAAMIAPSAGNQQPWQFVVVRDRDTLEKIKDVNPYAPMADHAPLGILVCGDVSLEKHPGFWVQDCSAAVQNLLLAVRGLGLGGVWTGIYPLEERVNGFRELFGLPENVIPLAFVVIGHPAQESSVKDRYKEERVRWERW
ncbi:MAG: nitroreductase family protein [Desulfococcaceae bacterium]